MKVARDFLELQTTMILRAEGLVAALPVYLVVPTTAMQVVVQWAHRVLASLALQIIMIKMVITSAKVVLVSLEARKPGGVIRRDSYARFE